MMASSPSIKATGLAAMCSFTRGTGTEKQPGAVAPAIGRGPFEPQTTYSAWAR